MILEHLTAQLNGVLKSLFWQQPVTSAAEAEMILLHLTARLKPVPLPKPFLCSL